jgi:hypothetical protein
MFILKAMYTERSGAMFEHEPEGEMVMDNTTHVEDYVAAGILNGSLVPLHLYYCSLLFPKLKAGDI